MDFDSARGLKVGKAEDLFTKTLWELEEIGN